MRHDHGLMGRYRSRPSHAKDTDQKVRKLIVEKEEFIPMYRRKPTDAEIDKLEYGALVEKLEPIGAARFIGLQLEQRPRNEYTEVQDKVFEGMTVE